MSAQESNEQANQGIDGVSARNAFESILSQRQGEKFEKASSDFEAMCKVWNPVGRTVEEIKRVFGRPDWEKQEALGYQFDSGWGGWEWRLDVHNQVVTKIRRLGIY